MDILNAVFAALPSIASSLIGIVVNVFSGVTSLWYTPPTTSGGTGELTVLGVFSLIAFTSATIWLGIKFIGSMISLKTAR